VKTIGTIVLAVAAVVLSSIALAQYPAKPVQIVSPFAAGGVGDVVARAVAQKLAEQTGKAFVVENRTGAGGRIGFNAVAKSAPDGYTLAVTDATYVILPSLYNDLPWDAENDLIPIIIYSRNSYVIVVPPNGKFSSLRELVAYARANPGKINYGSSGIGAINHVVTEMFAREAGIELTHIPYKGMGDAITGMLSGSIDLLIVSMPSVMGQVRNGRVVALAVTSAERAAALPDVPTAKEAGVSMVVSNWIGITTPSGTPKDVIDYLYREGVKALSSPQIKERFASVGAEPSGEGPSQFAAILREDRKRWSDVIRAAAIKVD